MAAHPPDLVRLRPLESRVRRKLQARFGEGRMEKDAVGFPRGQKNSDVRRTSPAAYSTAAGGGGGRSHAWQISTPPRSGPWPILTVMTIRPARSRPAHLTPGPGVLW